MELGKTPSHSYSARHAGQTKSDLGASIGYSSYDSSYSSTMSMYKCMYNWYLGKEALVRLGGIVGGKIRGYEKKL